MLRLRSRKLIRLQNELQSIDVLNRLREYDPDPTDDDVYLARQARRSQILAEIAKLEGKSSGPNVRGLAAGVALILGATLYTTYHYLLRFHSLLR
jgi:hypothetical protein